MKTVKFSDVAVGSMFAWHGFPYLKASETIAHPIEKNNKPSMYSLSVGAWEPVVVSVK